MCYVNNLFACIMDFISVTDIAIVEFFKHDFHLIYYTRVQNVCEYFQSTHCLVPGYCLGQISCAERSNEMAAPEPNQW